MVKIYVKIFDPQTFLWRNLQVNRILMLILGSAHLSVSTLNVLRLTMRGCDIIALANLFLVFPIMQVSLRVRWGVAVCQRSSLSLANSDVA